MRFKSTNRRAFLAVSGLTVIGMTACATSPKKPSASAIPKGAMVTASPTPGNQTMPTSNQALQKLLAGNLRFQRGQTIRPNQSLAQLQAIANKQTPFAIVFSCADSRVPPELVFDQGLGDIFTIRTAGHVLDDAALGTIEYGVAELAIPLLVVLGHERCGAVKATIEAVDHHTVVPGSIQSLVDYIHPSVLKAQGQGDVRLANAIHINISYTVNQLSHSKIISDAVKAGKLTIVGGDFDLDTGAVKIITS